ncbi:polysaccharide biosynthesis tyrosine autokinase [Ideonella dechloratans]|uniref:polysaccharide biosynthesis tyrosine autokinase n=1 Tax=Ideonella dechloratans TaxID=36863 RepID=UPI0035B32A6E
MTTDSPTTPRSRPQSNDQGEGPASTFGQLPTSEDVRSIGEIIRDTRNLSAEQVGQILAYQKTHGVRFGEAAIALGFATPDDVLHALAQQFNYAYAGESGDKANPELVVLNQPFSQQAEAFRAIRAQILLRTQPGAVEGAPKVKRALAVVSPNSGDGKTFFCANLAVALAQMGGKTLVVDADLRGPRMHDVFGVDAGTGLTGLLTGRRGEGVVNSVKGVPNLFVLPVGISPPNPLELLQGPAFGLLLHELLKKFDHVVVDTPAGQYGSDGIVAAARCGVALVVARKDAARIHSLRELIQNLAATGAQVTGVVMNEF